MGGVSDRVDVDCEARGVGSAVDATDRTFGVVRGEVVAAEVVVARVVGKHLCQTSIDLFLGPSVPPTLEES